MEDAYLYSFDMKLTTAQVVILGDKAKVAFAARALAYLCDKHSEVSQRVGPHRIRAILDVSLERCRVHDAASENCVVALADLSLTYSRDVYLNDGWVQEILSNEHIDVSQKALRLKSYL
jgi:hypothetical protein